MSKLSGDPERLAREAAKEEQERSAKILEEAYVTSQRLLEESFKKSLMESERRLGEEFSLLEEQLKSLRSRLEYEMKAKLAERRNEIVEEVMGRALQIFKEMKREAWYEKFLQRSIERALAEAGRAEEVELRAAEEDMKLVREIASRYKVKVSPEPANIVGGIIAVVRGGELRLDFSVDLFLSRNDARLRNLALKALME
ncbi:MAG: V-type ATP synthase subunit E family protein [Acidilobaceae archaeon]|nr:V-type ATP synthase subunit E family protein [Acidilobaceae archaeon]MDW7974735.1 V-type ATP synthase subunit E family protein [Sulfolobales archaeon]